MTHLEGFLSSGIFSYFSMGESVRVSSSSDHGSRIWLNSFFKLRYVLPILPKGLLETEPLQGRDEDTVASADFPSMLSEEEKEELKAELVQVCLVIFLLLLCLSPNPENYC